MVFPTECISVNNSPGGLSSTKFFTIYFLFVFSFFFFFFPYFSVLNITQNLKSKLEPYKLLAKPFHCHYILHHVFSIYALLDFKLHEHVHEYCRAGTLRISLIPALPEHAMSTNTALLRGAT